MIKNAVILLLLVLSLVIFFWFVFYRSSPDTQAPKDKFATVRGHKLFLEVAATPMEKTKGLSARESMPENQGMIFTYARPGRYQFWMMGMKFNLDFIFVNGNTIVDLAENIPFPTGAKVPARIRGQENYDKVIETNAGLVKKWGLKKGDRLKFSF